MSVDSAVEITSLDPGGPASKAGLHHGDLIVAINDHVVNSVDDLYHFLSEWPAGNEVSLTVVRHAQKVTLSAVPTEMRHCSVMNEWMDEC